MREKIKKAVRKSIEFEKSGEIFSIEVCLNNISPQVREKDISDMLDTLYQEIKVAIF